MTARTARSLFVALFALLVSRPALAEERITRYHADITVAENGRLTVHETIAVNVENLRINHGIMRDFPAGMDRVGLEEVTLDGHSEPYTKESGSDGVRIRIGRADRFVSPGPHVYDITYRTTPKIGFFSDFDRLYWNVTGNGWAFPIDAAEADVHLPSRASIVKAELFTGFFGSTAHDGTISELAGGQIHAATIRPLMVNEGLTIDIKMAKGIVRLPTTIESATSWVQGNVVTVVALLGLVTLAVYYLLVWSSVGRDPSLGKVVPIATPPAGVSAGAVRFNTRMGYDSKTFMVTMVGMAAKGFLEISSVEGSYKLERTGMSESEARLLPEEKAIAALLREQREFDLDSKNSADISKAISNLRAALIQASEGIYFSTNRGWWAGGAVITIVTAVAIAATASVPQYGSAVPGALAVIVQFVLLGVFFNILKAPTAKGARLRQEIEGFRLFVKSRGSITKEVFEEYLPYAMALNLEQEWNRKCAGFSPDGGAFEDSPYRPSWFAGDDGAVWNVYLFSRVMTSSVDTASVDPSAAAASANSYDSSGGGGFDAGGGGGGSSGGGDGGGGGGGW